MNKVMFNAKQLKMDKFENYIWQLIISTSNATLEVPSLSLWFLKNHRFLLPFLSISYNNFLFLFPKFEDFSGSS